MDKNPGIWLVSGLLVVVLGGRTVGSDKADALTRRIDEHLAGVWAAEKVQPAPRADDATFCRRVHLDLVGRVPTVAETRAFLADTSPDKRRKLVERLLESPGYALHFATFWRRAWVPEADVNRQRNLDEDIDRWLRLRLHEGERYDRLVQGLLSPPAEGRDGLGTLAGQAFQIANENRPENLAAGSTRAFLGLNLDCAQCHDHPFARWTRAQFWETAAFFVRPAAATEGMPRLTLAIPGTKRVVGPRLLTGREPEWPAQLDDYTGRRLLANWVTAPDNPYFARNAVNRLWAYLLGTGLLEPLDDLTDASAANQTALLEEMAKALVESGFDLRLVLRAITASRAYQAESTRTDGSPPDPRLFARMPVRGLSGEQLYDSLRTAAGLPPLREDIKGVAAGRTRREFALRFREQRPAKAERSILQALALMNGSLTAELTRPETSPTLKAVATAPFLDTRGKVETLFLAALGRPPSADELAPLIKHVEGGGAGALIDVFWALMNSSEFSCIR